MVKITKGDEGITGRRFRNIGKEEEDKNVQSGRCEVVQAERNEKM